MIKKIVLTVAVAAFAVSAPTASFAKKMHHHASKCTPGQMMSGKPNAMGWAPVMACGADGKMYQTIMMCMMASSLCPPSM